jgi:glutamyl-tRNA synthetase/glutamyl-Q tRNA(Asp) synthetase
MHIVPDLDALAARLPPRPRTRFAPSPTGFLHLGHVVNAVYTWGIARALGGVVLLRVEDHDSERSRPEYERAILDDLAWLGLQADAWDAQNSARTARQSDREPIYAGALSALEARGLVYACSCSRKQIEERGGAEGGELRYPGTCRTRRLPRADGAGLRVRLDPGVECFDDALAGPQVQEPAVQSGDLLIRDRIGQWTYQFAVTVDDMDQQVDLVIRGADLLPSTGRQIRLARLLGRATPPVFLHHPLLYSPMGAKLSKSNRDTGIRELRASGLAAADVLGLAASRAGLVALPRPVAVGELAALFARTHTGQSVGRAEALPHVQPRRS